MKRILILYIITLSVISNSTINVININIQKSIKLVRTSSIKKIAFIYLENRSVISKISV